MIDNTSFRTLPGPKGTAVDELQRFSTDQLGYIEDCYHHYGSIFQLPFSPEGDLANCVVVSEPEAIKFLHNPAMLKFIENKKATAGDCFLGGTGHLASSDKATHQRLKRLMMPIFTPQAVQSRIQQIWNIAQTVSQAWEPGNTLWVFEAMRTFTFEVILRVVFGLQDDRSYESLTHWIAAWMTWSAKPEVGQTFMFEELQKDEGLESPWGRHRYNLSKIDEILYDHIRSRRMDSDLPGGQDILSRLVTAKDEAGNSLTDTEIRDVLILMLVAGHETTANALAGTFYQLHRHPSILQKLKQELESFKRVEQVPEICKLPYFSAVCNEALRFYSVTEVSFSRILTTSLELMGYQFEVGTIVYPSYYLLHRRSDIYPEPEKFYPERFLERSYASHEFAPFGGGHHHCLGYALADLQMKIALTLFLSNAKFELLRDEPVKFNVKYGLPQIDDFQVRILD